MSMTFSGQVALVTGAAAGIGRATALASDQQGLKVVLATSTRLASATAPRPFAPRVARRSPFVVT